MADPEIAAWLADLGLAIVLSAIEAAQAQLT